VDDFRSVANETGSGKRQAPARAGAPRHAQQDDDAQCHAQQHMQGPNSDSRRAARKKVDDLRDTPEKDHEPGRYPVQQDAAIVVARRSPGNCGRGLRDISGLGFHVDPMLRDVTSDI